MTTDEQESLVTPTPRHSRPERELPPTPQNSDTIASNGTPHHVVAEPSTTLNNDHTNLELSELTSLRAHYLKKTLVSLQLHNELDIITTPSTNPSVSTLSYLGSPFSPPPRDAPFLDLPFLRYIFRQFVVTFPFLLNAPKDFFSQKLQPFIASVLSRNLSPTNVMEEDSEDSEQATRKRILSKMEKDFGLLLTSATKLVEPEEVVRLSQADLSRLESLAKKRQVRMQREKEVFEVNIVCIRAVVDKGRMRSKVHEEFIIRTRRSNFPDVYVSRRYGDFRTLAEELRKRYPDEMVRSPPAKDRTTVSATAAAPVSVSASPTSSRIPTSYSSQPNDSSESIVSLSTHLVIQNIRLAREKNRLTLRAYLNSLLNSSVLGSSPVLLHFLISNPTTLSRDEQEDARRREEADHKRDEGRIHFAHEITSRVESLRSAIRDVKGDIMARDGLSRVFGIIRVTENVRDLPGEYQAVIEWGRISLASTIFQYFIASDNASESFATLKRLHGLMPYFMLKGILKISNPIAMVRGVLDLFLAQPFGGRSLLQRMFTSSLQEDVKFLQEEIEAVRERVDDDVICEKIRQFIYAPKEIQNIYKADAAAEGMNLLTIVLRSGEQPVLTRPQLQRIMRAHRAHAEYLRHREELADSDEDDGPQNDDAWLYEDLTILAKLYSQLRDKEQIIELMFEGNTAELLKDILTIFYSPLAQVYKAASIGDSLSDLQNFINDLIRTVEACEAGQEDPRVVVQAFISLVERHEQSFYGFVHKVHSKGEGLFDNMMKWVQIILNLFQDGFSERVSLEFLLPHTGQERSAIMKEVDDIALYHYKLKLAHESKLRKRFTRSQVGSEADAEDEAAQALVDSVVNDFSIDELVSGDIAELEALESGEDTSSEESDDDELEDGEEDEVSSEYETASESEDEDDAPPVPPKPVERSSTFPQSFQPPRMKKNDKDQLHRQHQSQQTGHRGRNEKRQSDPNGQRLRSRSRSLVALKSIFNRGSLEGDKTAPPVPPLPALVPHPPYNKHLPASPLSARSSLDDHPNTPNTPNGSSQKRMRLIPTKQRKKKKQASTPKPPELKEIPKLLPIFVEIMRPLLRPTAVN